MSGVCPACGEEYGNQYIRHLIEKDHPELREQ